MNSPRAEDEPDELILGILITDILRLMRHDFVARTRAMPLSPALHRLLIHVQRRPGRRQVELAEWLDLTPVTVGRMLDRLERQKLVRRENHPVDRRASCVYVGKGAGELLSHLTAKANETRQRAVEGLSPQQRRELIASLRQVKSNLQADDEPSADSLRSPS